MVDYRSTENHKTELQWLAEGFVLNETPSGTTEWNNRFHTFRVTRYSDHDVHEDPEKALSLLKEHRQTMKAKGAKKNKSRQERQIYTRIVGVTFINDETGENRQSIISSLAKRGFLKFGYPLGLKREPENPYDNQAIAVIGPCSRTLGYINRGLAAELAPLIDKGAEVHACVSRLLGDGKDFHWGVEIRLLV